ncbi:MAG: ABC transporter ATP-binding protein [Cytophagaceae bacterium]
MQEAAVVIKNLTKYYGKESVKAVSDVSFEIKKGELFGLLGPNGAGKTTMISAITGLVKPSSGNVLIFGHDVVEEYDLVKKRIGLVPQSIALYPSLTGRENLKFFGRMSGLGNKEIYERVDKWLEIMGLSKSADRKVDGYSGGMKRRINLIAGLLHEPELLILDEPTVGVDVQSRIVILEQLKEINKSGTTIIYTSHYLEEAENLCTSLVIVDKGTVLCSGTPQDLFNKYHCGKNLEELFITLTGRTLRD